MWVGFVRGYLCLKGGHACVFVRVCKSERCIWRVLRCDAGILKELVVRCL